jgi:hypothetical protein
MDHWAHAHHCRCGHLVRGKTDASEFGRQCLDAKAVSDKAPEFSYRSGQIAPPARIQVVQGCPAQQIAADWYPVLVPGRCPFRCPQSAPWPQQSAAPCFPRPESKMSQGNHVSTWLAGGCADLTDQLEPLEGARARRAQKARRAIAGQRHPLPIAYPLTRNGNQGDCAAAVQPNVEPGGGPPFNEAPHPGRATRPCGRRSLHPAHQDPSRTSGSSETSRLLPP